MGLLLLSHSLLCYSRQYCCVVVVVVALLFVVVDPVYSAQMTLQPTLFFLEPLSSNNAFTFLRVHKLKINMIIC